MKIQNLTCPEKGKLQKLHVDKIELEYNETGAELSVEEMDICYFVISGYGTLKVDEYLYSLSPQSSVYIPAHSPHWFSNTGTGEFSLVRYYTQG